jgi:hypothetical protein
MNRNNLWLPFFALALCILMFPSAVTALETQSFQEQPVKSLSPTIPYKPVLQSATLQEIPGGYTVQVSGTIQPGDKIYDVIVSPETLTYRVEYKENLNPLSLMGSWSDSGTVYRPGTGNNLIARTRAKTFDPVELVVCSTSVKFTYNNNGSTVTPVSRAVETTDYSGLTHWYCSSKSYSGSGSNASAVAEHYNDDFMNDNKRTNVSHSVSLNIAGSAINWSGQVTVTGDWNFLLATSFQPIW